MPRFKVLKGVAHNIGHSFTSLMNYSVDDYTMGHILRLARETEFDTLTLNLMTGEGKPAELLGDPIAELPQWYTKMFLNMVQSSGSDRALLQSATLTLKYDLLRTIPAPIGNDRQSPYQCDVSILDIRGKTYDSHFEGWWHLERASPPPPARVWWNPMTWVRR
jgi:hypothetical protein